MKEALFYKKLDSNQVSCELCPHNCIINENHTGRCNVRKNVEGILYSMNYGKVSGLAVDPIEKKPIHFWRPGSQILSFGTYGCNMTCKFCQNYDISQNTPVFKMITPEEIVNEAKRLSLKAIAYTYNEPTVFYEMMLETALLAKENDIANVLVSNGFINEKPLKKLIPYIDAANIDVKTYDQGLYRAICSGALEPVLKTIKLLVTENVHVEITCLLVPGLFEDLTLVEAFFKNLSLVAKDAPIHLSRYFPRYLYNEPPTDIGKMLEIQYIAQKYFSYAKLGNIY